MKVIIYFLLSVFMLLGSIILLLQIPAIQTVLVQKVATVVSTKINYPITIEGVNIKWFNTLVLENVSINDKKSESLIGVDRVEVEFNLKSLIKGDSVIIDAANFYSPVVILDWDIETNKLNINEFIYNVRNSFKKKKNKKPKIKPFEIVNASIHNGFFAYTDHRKQRKTTKMFDHNFFSVDSIYAQCNNFFLHRDTVQLQITNLKGIEENIDFNLNDIDMFFRYTRSSLEFKDISAHIEDSYISNNIELRYLNPSSINHFIDSVTVTANLDSTVIHAKDLAHFAPSISKIKDRWVLYGDYKGKVGTFRSSNASIYFGKNSRIKGSIDFEGLPEFNETFMTLDLHNSKTNANDLSKYLSNNKQIKAANKFGNIKFDADFAGFPKDFVSHGDFTTSLGDFYGDLRFELKNKNAQANYSGHITTDNFQLGNFLDDKRVGEIGINGKIKGSGFTLEKAKIKLDADINHILINKYNYKNITTNAQLQDEFFSGFISIQDSNLNLTTEGTIDLRADKEIVQVNARIKKAQLDKLKISKDKIFIKSDFEMNVQNLDLDLIEGNANIRNTFVNHNGNKVKFNDFVFESVLDSNNRTIDINSDLIAFNAKGDFKFNQIYKDLNNIVKEYGLMFLNDSSTTSKYYAKKKLSPQNYHIDFETKFKDANQLFDLIDFNAYISPGTILKGKIAQGKTTLLDLSTEIDFLKYNDISLHNTSIELNSAKEADSTKALAMLYINSEQQDFNNKPTSKNLFFEGIWFNDTINFNTNITHIKEKSSAVLKGNISFHKNQIYTSLNNSSLHFLNDKWVINNQNNIVYKVKSAKFNNINFTNGNQELTINGGIGGDNKTLISLENFNLLNLESIANIKLKGELNGEVEIQDLWEQKPKVLGEVHIKDFTIKDELIGDINGTCKWNDANKKFNFNVNALRNEIKIARLKGHYSPKNKTSPLFAEAYFENTDIGFLEPLLYGQATNIKGKANGKLVAKGSFNKLNLRGSPRISEGEFTIDYFKTRYKFNEPIYFRGDSIIVKNGVLTDTLWKTTGKINGYITHDVFKNFKSDLTLSLNKTFVLNTSEQDNSLYYGQAFGSGDITLKGPFSDLKVYSDELSSQKGTKIYVPLEGTANITQKDYIRFVSREEKRKEELQKQAEEKETKNKKAKSGISADLNFNINENAHFEIIFDKKAGDIIRGKGKGDVLIKMDTRGDFEAYGTCYITQGTYNFTLVNLINKSFKIQPESEITWSGDPYEGKLNIQAAYRQNASLLPIINNVIDSTYIIEHPELKRRTPVTVLLNLKGRLLSPEINFGINITDYPNDQFLEPVIQDFHSRIKFNEQLLNNQVFSLMVLKQLSPLDQLQVDVGTSSANSVSELFSNQFSYWISQFDENLEVDIDLSGFDEEDNNTFRLRLSYSILDGKMRITRDGNFTNVENQSQLANVFGEWTIEYLLTDNGKLKLKAYNKTNQSTISSALNSTNNTYGLSMTYTESFDSLKELFKKNPNKSEAKKEDEIIIEKDKEENEETNNESDEKPQE